MDVDGMAPLDDHVPPTTWRVFFALFMSISVYGVGRVQWSSWMHSWIMLDSHWTGLTWTLSQGGSSPSQAQLGKYDYSWCSKGVFERPNMDRSVHDKNKAFWIPNWSGYVHHMLSRKKQSKTNTDCNPTKFGSSVEMNKNTKLCASWHWRQWVGPHQRSGWTCLQPYDKVRSTCNNTSF